MRVAVPKEIAPGERRVALVPEIVEKLAAGGFDVAVEHGAGEAAAFSDAEYRDAGAQVVALGELFTDAEGVMKVQKPSAEEVERLPEGSILIAFLQPLTDPDGIQRLTRRGVTGFALESVPRITRAQPMDALSSQATVSGYKAVLLAADRLPRFFPMLMTAAGRSRPPRCSCWARASPASRRSRPRGGWERSCPDTTCAPWYASRSRASARAFSISASSARRPRVDTRAS